MATFLGGASIGGDSVSGDKIVHMAAVPPEDGRPPRQLPPDVPGFTGRQAVLSQLNELISAEDRTGPVIAAITGMPGIGKTALAVHWAHLISGRFPDGHIFIDLRGCSKRAALSPREALGQALRALRAPAERLPVDEDELAASYRSRLADKRMLIVLDDAAGSRQVYPLIPGSPSCVVVVTARGKLAGLVARYGARATALELLPASEALDLISVVAGRQRAEAEPEATMELVHMCARLPLALRMAAANLAIRPQQTVADTVEALAEGDRLSNLTLGEDPGEAVGAAFELSYRGLFPEAQRAFRLLGLVDGPNVVPDAVGALLAATPEAARRLLGQLEAASLVEAIGGNRYHLHELLHDYARGRAAQDDSPIVRSAAIERLATWYLTTAQQAGRFLDRYRRTMRQELTAPPVNADPAERTHHLDWFALEQPNLTELTRQVARLRWDELTWELADAVYDFFELRRYCHENLEVQRLGLAAAQRKSNLVALFFMHHHLAVIHRELGQARESLAEDALALEISVQTQDRYGEAAALDNMARTHLQLSDYSMTLELGRRALSIRREIGDRHGEAMTLDTLARGRLGLSQYRGSFELAREALLIRRAIGDLRGEAETLDNIARIYHGWGRINESLHSAERALEICKEVGDRHGEGQTLAFLGYLYMWIGSHAQGRAHAERSLDIRQKIDDPHGEGQALVYLSTIRRRLGRYEEAVQSGLEALDILQALGDRHGEAEALESLSRSFRRMGMHERARRDAERSLAIRRSIRDVHGSAKALNALGLIELHSGHPNLARSAAKRALRLRRRLDDQPGIADSLDLLGKIYLRMGRSEKALRTAERALDVAERIGQHYGQIITLGSLGEILWRLDRREAALESLQLARQMAAQMGDLHEEAKVLRLQAEIHAELGRPDQSQAATVEAASLIRELDKLPQRIGRDLAAIVVQLLWGLSEIPMQTHQECPLHDLNDRFLTCRVILRLYYGHRRPEFLGVPRRRYSLHYTYRNGNCTYVASKARRERGRVPFFLQFAIMRSLADTEAGRVVRPPVPTRLLGGRDWVTGPVNRWFVRSYTEHDQVPDWLSTDLVADAARKLALVHRVASTFDPGVWCPPVGGLQVYDWGVADSLDRPEALIEDMRRRGRTPGHIRSVTARLDLLGAERVGLDLGPEGLTHHDLRTENLLVRGGEVVEIVDWDRAHWDVQWYDVTLAGLHLAYLQPAGLRWDLARVFLDAYQAESQVKLTPDALSWLFRYTAVRNLAVSRSPGKWAHLMKGVDERWGSRPSVFVDDLIA